MFCLFCYIAALMWSYSGARFVSCEYLLFGVSLCFYLWFVCFFFVLFFFLIFLCRLFWLKSNFCVSYGAAISLVRVDYVMMG